MADQGVVRVVPLRSLRVQPDPAIDDEIAELGQQRHQQLLQQVDLVDVSAAFQHQLAVCACRGDPVRYSSRERVVIVHGSLRVRDDFLEAPDPIRHVCITEDGPVQERAEACRMKLPGLFQELQQIDDLVVAPVADVTPWIVRFIDLPVDSFPGNAIRVVSIHGRSVDELGDDVLDELREAESQRLPVLEDVPPVALVGQQWFAASILQPDRELVPRATRIAVTATECDRQVLVAEPFQLRVAGPLHG